VTLPGLMLQLDDASIAAIDAALETIKIPHHRQVVQAAFKGATKLVSDRYRELLPAPKDPQSAERDGRKHVAAMPNFRVRIYERAIVAFAGFESRKKFEGKRRLPSNIDALLEKGWTASGTGQKIPGHNTLATAISQTESQVKATIVAAVVKSVTEAADYMRRKSSSP
jgi:hypothetical protein